MSERVKRRRLQAKSKNDNGSISEAVAGKTMADIRNSDWEGFSEVESDPALFNVMLREMGVKGVKVQEVFSLDDEMLAFLPQPVYGLIFLFRWKEDETEGQEASCPKELWFANQTVKDACATVALLNIVNNIKGIELGDNLQHFKEFTKDFSPALRGDAISNFEFVKRIHNSFTRKMDMLNVDMALKNEVIASKRKAKDSGNDEEAGFHFIAFIPFEGRVWQFDGLERQPRDLGKVSDHDWLSHAKPVILSRMASYEQDQIEFSILGLVADPYLSAKQELLANVKALRFAAGLNSEKHEDGSRLLKELAKDGIISGPDAAIGLDKNDFDDETATGEFSRSAVNELAEAQKALRSRLKEEHQYRDADEQRAAGRRHDYGPAIHAWARALARKKLAQDLIAESWE